MPPNIQLKGFARERRFAANIGVGRLPVASPLVFFCIAQWHTSCCFDKHFVQQNVPFFKSVLHRRLGVDDFICDSQYSTFTFQMPTLSPLFFLHWIFQQSFCEALRSLWFTEMVRTG